MNATQYQFLTIDYPTSILGSMNEFKTPIEIKIRKSGVGGLFDYGFLDEELGDLVYPELELVSVVSDNTNVMPLLSDKRLADVKSDISTILGYLSWVEMPDKQSDFLTLGYTGYFVNMDAFKPPINVKIRKSDAAALFDEDKGFGMNQIL